MPKRQAVYAAAAIRGIALASYDPGGCRLSVPAAAPLPELYARSACLSGGRSAEIAGEALVYHDVPPSLGHALLVLLGQQLPGTT